MTKTLGRMPIEHVNQSMIHMNQSTVPVMNAAAPPPPGSPKTSLLTSVYQTRLVQGLWNIITSMPKVSDIERREGQDIWTRMRSDDAVFAAEFQLTSRILSRPWDVHPPEPLKGDRFAGEVAEYVKGVFSSMNTEAMLEHLLRALRQRYAGGQLVYRADGGVLTPERFVAERRAIFSFSERGRLLLRISALPEEAEDYKWAWHVNEPEPERPDGRSVFERVYWPWKFKREAGWKLWVVAMQRFSVPSLAALFEMAEWDLNKAREIAELVNAELAKVASGSVGVLANTKSLVPIGGAKAVEGFDTFLEMCDRCIYRGLLTTTLTVSEGKTGAERGDTSVHDRTADRVAQHYAKQIAESVTMTVGAYAALLRFGERARAVLPRFTFDFDEPLTLAMILKVIETTEGQLPVSLRALYSRYGVPEPGDEEDAFTMNAAVGRPPVSEPPPGLSRSGAVSTLSFPAEDEPLVRRKLFTYLRDREIKARFEALRDDGATWEEALDALAGKNRWNLARDTYRNILSRR